MYLVGLAKQAGARYLLFVASDVECVTRIDFAHLEQLISDDARVAQISVAITPDSAQAHSFPWMTQAASGRVRVVPHADFFISIFDVAFIESFGGFPESRGGWYFDWELAYQAKRQSRLILVADSCVVRHDWLPQDDQAAHRRAEKRREAERVYRAKYGDLRPQRFREAVSRRYWQFLGREYRGPVGQAVG